MNPHRGPSAAASARRSRPSSSPRTAMNDRPIACAWAATGMLTAARRPDRPRRPACEWILQQVQPAPQAVSADGVPGPGQAAARRAPCARRHVVLPARPGPLAARDLRRAAQPRGRARAPGHPPAARRWPTRRWQLDRAVLQELLTRCQPSGARAEDAPRQSETARNWQESTSSLLVLVCNVFGLWPSRPHACARRYCP